jgi:hypothetical protein
MHHHQDEGRKKASKRAVKKQASEMMVGRQII